MGHMYTFCPCAVGLVGDVGVEVVGAGAEAASRLPHPEYTSMNTKMISAFIARSITSARAAREQSELGR